MNPGLKKWMASHKKGGKSKTSKKNGKNAIATKIKNSKSAKKGKNPKMSGKAYWASVKAKGKKSKK